MEEKYQPLQFPPLFKDAWVFSIYGLIISAVMAEYDRKGASLDVIQGFLLEPFSIKAFFSITFVGFILVALGAMILGMDEAKARKNKLMRCFCVPISEVGLSAGFIVVGMSLGIAAYFYLFGSSSVDADMASVNLKISLMVLFIITPIYWLQRSVFSIDNKERRLLAAVMVSYIVIVYGSILLVNPEHFFMLSIFTIVLFAILWGVKLFLVNKAIKPTQ
jgi:uncharacterized membrane protein